MLTVSGMMVILLLNVTAADAPPPFAEIVKKVVTATSPSKPYEVDVKQTIAKGQGAGAEQAKSTFSLAWEPGKGISMKKAEAAAETSGQAAAAKPEVKVQIDLTRFVQDMAKWPGVTVAAEPLNARPCFKASGKSNKDGTGCTLWIDAEQWTVTKASIDVNGQRLADLTAEYRREKDAYWLVSKATITQARDGSVVTQQFGPYRFSGQ